MEHLLKIYIYKEGEKPIFHQPGLTGIYAGEGWFMKLIARSKRFVVEDPENAHLYYLPFSSTTLRWTLYDDKTHNVRNLENFLRDYVDLIKNKYSYWNATKGADHFFVACHDWVCHRSSIPTLCLSYFHLIFYIFDILCVTQYRSRILFEPDPLTKIASSAYC